VASGAMGEEEVKNEINKGKYCLLKTEGGEVK